MPDPYTGVQHRFLEGTYERKHYFYLRSLEISMRLSAEYIFNAEKESDFIIMTFKQLL